MKRSMVFSALLSVALVPVLLAEEPVDLQVISRIKAEGFGNSQVMDTLSWLTDVAGPRLTGSPGMKKAAEWARDAMTEWGLKNAHLEAWGPFGRGWVLDGFSCEMTEPYYLNMIAYPKAWTSGTTDVISGPPIYIQAQSIEDLEEYKGKLKGAIVLTQPATSVEPTFEPDAKRYTEEELAGVAKARVGGRGGRRGRNAARFGDFRARRALRREMNRVFREEGVAAILEPSRGQHGTLFVSSGGSRGVDAEPALPQLVVAVEHYGMIIRLLEKDIPVQLRVDVQARFLDETDDYNVVAEIPGTDMNIGNELVLLGGHLDSWHSATGATDNAAGCAVAMEAARILKAIGVSPRRTIRVVLWSGEEQGLLGSRAYVKEHFGDRNTMELLPDHSKFAGYFNLDNGTGRIRGIYCQGNDAVRPIFEAYLKPFHDMDATTVTVRNTGGTDHQSFDAVGLPGFQFIQDTVEYNTRTHHTNMDTYERLQPADMMQASVIMASFVYHTAMRDEKLPRKALPAPRPPRVPRGETRAASTP